ncbi:phospho-2-dehydro-3-deoxyheptonate aldolase [Pseudomonas aeruginosa VRFPA02]|nr:phospho-2-dehydro-3-deoxyheptonate aldolase [Pseudomonas aeruginosa VRFPA02]
MDDLLQRVRRCEALQQPEWGDPSRLRDVQAYLRGSPALIRAGDWRASPRCPRCTPTTARCATSRTWR